MTQQSTTEQVAFWELDAQEDLRLSPVHDSVQPCISTSGAVDIGIFEEPRDIRTLVKEEDARPDGKYHSILKLFFRFGDSGTWTTATGWLLKDDLAVTAAHCVYEDSHRATFIKACIDYDIRSRSSNASYEKQRSVSRVALPFEWINAQADRYDVAFLQLQSPFQDVTPIVRDVPETNAQQQLKVVGYPTDLKAGGESGGEMYEMVIDRPINLAHTKGNMLVYQGDQHGGFSGAPVLRGGDPVAVGMHVRGGSFNSAVVIGGPYGIRFQAYEELLEKLGKGDDTSFGLGVQFDVDRKWLKVVHVLCDTQV